MYKNFLAYFCLSLMAATSFSINAATTSAAKTSVPVVSVMDPVSDRLNINSADAESLQKVLSGIGKTKAESIVTYREANGSFASVDELMEIKGIGSALLERNRNKLTVE